MVWPWLSCLLLPALMVSVAANVAPTFLPNMSAVNLPEDLPVGAEVFWLIAQDQDNDPLTYEISGSYAYFFNVTPNTGEVKLANPLDYETLYWFAINIFVNDGHNTPVQNEMLVIVEDRNDNAPIFQKTDFSTSISETLPVGSLLLSVLAKDKDTGSGGAVVYSIEKVIPSTDSSEYLFRILPNGSIILNGSLSYNNKSAFYQLELKACDSGGRYNNSFVVQCSSPVFVSISVIDKPDLDPQFVREFYSASVAEDAPQGTSVLKVEAMDGDRGINDPVIYSISNSTRPGWFDIGPDGVIRVNGSLDREQLLEEDEEVQVQVTATEMHPNVYGQEAKVSIWVTLRVTDVNDHKPEFYNCSLPTCTFTPQEAQVNFTGYVDEHASTHIPIDDLTMVVYDPDKGSNGTFLLSLGGPDVEAFSVSPERAVGSVDVQVLVRAPSLVDYETQTVMLVQVVATDSVSRSSSVALVTIHLRDINDHRPTFPHNLYNLSVFEHSAVGYVVTNGIRASDPDTGEGGRITYSLLPGNGADIFAVDPDSGTVTVRNSELLDREKQAVYYLTLLATDGGNLSSSTMLQIVVLDINDNKPVVSGSYNIFVQEEEGNVSVTIQAHDDDQPGTNHSLLHFSLLSSPNSHNFSVDPDKGILRNLGPLDREAINPTLGGRIVLTVRVSDCGEPALWTDVNVTITVEDINDNLPIFNQSSYSFSVRERDPGSLPITIEDVNDNAPYFLPENKTFVIIPELVIPNQQVASVQARDDDSGNNGAILFSILQVDFIAKDGAMIPFRGFFRVSTSLEASVFIGNIELVTNLDSTLQGTYQVTVKAQDRSSEGPAQEAKITLNLFTVDQSYRVRLQFSMSKEEVGANTEEIKAALVQATRTTVYIVNIQDIESTARARGRSYLDAYFVFSNGSALTIDQLSVTIRNDEDSLTKLLQLGLVVLGSQDVQESELPDTLRNTIIGLGVALLLVIVIMTTVLVCTQKSYHRKLRAMKASKEARKTAAGVMPPVSAIPGTNVYNTERANPVLNLPTKDLGFESQSSSSDLDHISLNSLDDNSVDLENSRQEIKKEPLHSLMGPDPEPLNRVLSEMKAGTHGQQKEELAFTNPGLNTTDL
ncbi:cadherin-related family member 2 isoform X3 [Balaenoptera ricei]|uniref:cadherin-related family member 2 isoform X3 n=1 Tax=Balaenoptera ricei TaxID=2746895 RepID=UPI0028BE4E1A|nr:cadherin-related family member 2 isoform X3 [Balaenoptera ricei]